jgi:hypothetical protein
MSGTGTADIKVWIVADYHKIIVGVLSVGDKYAIDIYGTLISSGGTAGYCVVAVPENFGLFYLLHSSYS